MLHRFIVVMLLIVFAFGSYVPVNAYVGESRPIPNFNGASGRATLDAYSSSRGVSSRSTIHVKRGSNQYCVYVEAAFYTILGLDGGWNIVQRSRTCSSTTVVYSASSFLSYNGMKYRICQDIPFRVDTCGAAVRIRR